jgi:hypothetical protein
MKIEHIKAETNQEGCISHHFIQEIKGKKNKRLVPF